MNVTKLQQIEQPCTNQKSRYKSTEPCMRIGIFAYTLSYSVNPSKSLPPLFIIHLSNAALAKRTHIKCIGKLYSGLMFFRQPKNHQKQFNCTGSGNFLKTPDPWYFFFIGKMVVQYPWDGGLPK